MLSVDVHQHIEKAAVALCVELAFALKYPSGHHSVMSKRIFAEAPDKWERQEYTKDFNPDATFFANICNKLSDACSVHLHDVFYEVLLSHTARMFPYQDQKDVANKRKIGMLCSPFLLDLVVKEAGLSNRQQAISSFSQPIAFCGGNSNRQDIAKSLCRPKICLLCFLTRDL